MTRINSLLKELTRELSGTEIRSGKSDPTRLRKLSIVKGGGLQFSMKNGQDYTVPMLGNFLTESVLYTAVRVVKGLVKYHIIGKVVHIFHLVSFILVLIAIATIIAIALGGKMLFDSFTR
jgi:hypothetical protein